MWPYREMVDAGITIGLSTDWPAVMSIDPIDTVYAAVTRSDFQGNPREGYYRNNALRWAKRCRLTRADPPTSKVLKTGWELWRRESWRTSSFWIEIRSNWTLWTSERFPLP